MVFYASLFTTQHYKVWIKGKLKAIHGKNSRPPLYRDVVAIEKGTFGSPSTTVVKFTLLYV